MKSLLVLFFLVHLSFEKEQVIYRADGGGLFDLIRGMKPKDGSLALTKLDLTDPSSLPDGIYFIPDGPVEEDAVKLNISIPEVLESADKKP